MANTRLQITVNPDFLPSGRVGQVCQLVRALLNAEPFRIGGSIRDKDLKGGHLVDFGEEALRDSFVVAARALLHEEVMLGVHLKERD